MFTDLVMGPSFRKWRIWGRTSVIVVIEVFSEAMLSSAHVLIVEIRRCEQVKMRMSRMTACSPAAVVSCSELTVCLSLTKDTHHAKLLDKSMNM